MNHVLQFFSTRICTLLILQSLLQACAYVAIPQDPTDRGVNQSIRYPNSNDFDSMLPKDQLLSDDQNLSMYEPEITGSTAADVVLFPRINQQQQLVLEIQLKNQINPWGIAFHFTYDPNLLRLIHVPEHDPSLIQDLTKMKMVKEAKPGYLMLFAAYPEPVAFRLTFDILQLGESALSFPLRGRMFKDENRKSKQLIWGNAALSIKKNGAW